MALFSRKKDAEEKKTDAAVVEKSSAKQALPTDHNLSNVIKRPRITEKSVMQSEKNVYTFEVQKDATKKDVAEAVKSIFSVTPVKVNIVNKQPRKVHSRMRGRTTSESGIKKAYVYLKQGDSINLI